MPVLLSQLAGCDTLAVRMQPAYLLSALSLTSLSLGLGALKHGCPWHWCCQCGEFLAHPKLFSLIPALCCCLVPSAVTPLDLCPAQT